MPTGCERTFVSLSDMTKRAREVEECYAPGQFVPFDFGELFKELKLEVVTRMSPLAAAFLALTSKSNMQLFKSYMRSTAALIILAAEEGNAPVFDYIVRHFDVPADLDMSECIKGAIRSGNVPMFEHVLQWAKEITGVFDIKDSIFRKVVTVFAEPHGHLDPSIARRFAMEGMWKEDIINNFIKAGRINELSEFCKSIDMIPVTFLFRDHVEACFYQCDVSIVMAAARIVGRISPGTNQRITLRELNPDPSNENGTLAFLLWTKENFQLQITLETIWSVLRANQRHVLDFLLNDCRLLDQWAPRLFLFGAFLTKDHASIFDYFLSHEKFVDSTSSFLTPSVYASLGSVAAVEYLIGKGIDKETIARKYNFPISDPAAVRFFLAPYHPRERRMNVAAVLDNVALYKSCIPEPTQPNVEESIKLLAVGAIKIFNFYYPEPEYFRYSQQELREALKELVDACPVYRVLRWLVLHGLEVEPDIVDWRMRCLWSGWYKTRIEPLFAGRPHE